MDLLDQWPGYTDPTYRACAALKGGAPGEDHVNGLSYLRHQYGIASYNLYWNVLILLGFWLLISISMGFVAVFIDYSPRRFSVNAWKKRRHLAGRPKCAKKVKPAQGNEVDEKNQVEMTEGGAEEGSADVSLSKSEDFTWKHIDYDVQVKGAARKLLNDVSGFVRSGQLTALMGSSGAGKTTLIDAVTQRKTIGKLTGHIYVGKIPQGPDFKKITAYCEQMDVHNPWCTVREALRFSAYLRQPTTVSKAEKDAYVEKIIKILELDPIVDAVIGSVGGEVGISLEQRKRVTIGVELVARPKIVFLGM
ncbi:hypothetical protein HDV00_004598 [Rhizophlyctis rosea]|nr:hypothetical protein HDV00_004598 [Rhizophlyctis rosea]